MSYKMDGDSIAPEVFTFAGPAPPQRKTRPLRNQKNKNNAAEQPSTARPSQPSQPSQPPQSSQHPPVSPISPPETNADFWEKPPAFCDISIKDALAPIKRNGVEIESPFTTDQVLRAAAAEIEQYNGEEFGEGKGMENYGWYLGKEEVDRKRKAAERAKYAGKAKGKGKVQGKLVNLSQLRAVAAGLAPNAAAGPSAVAPNSNNGGKPVRGYIARPSQKFVPIDSGSDTGSEYHDADCDCGCVSASDIEEEEQGASMADAAVQTSGKRPRTTCSDSDSYIPKPSYKGKEVERGPPSAASTILSMPPPPRESEDEYYGSDCGCEGEYCDSDCDFYPSDFYASDVYFDVERPATPNKQAPAATLSLYSSSPISYASTPSRSSPSDVENDTSDPHAEGRPQRRAMRSIPLPEVEDNIPGSGAYKAGRRAAAKEKALHQQGERSKHSPPAKRRRPTTSSSPPRGHRIVDANVVTLGQLALMGESRNAPNSFDRVPLPTRRQNVEPESQESDTDKIRRERMLEMERQRQFLQTLVADLPRMQQETAAIVAASFTSAPPNPYLPSPPDTPTPPFPGSTYADGNVLVVRRPSFPSDFDFEEEEVSEYDSETDPWTFIQQATARDIVRVERAGAEPSIDMLVRLQKSSRREAFGLWRDKLRSRQAARAIAAPQCTSLPSRPRTGPRANSASLRSVQEQATLPLRRRLEATGAPQERTTAMKLQLEAVLGPAAPSPRPSHPSSSSSSAQSKISSAISLSLQVEAELKAAASQPTSKHALEALASRHSKALSRMKESYESQSREIEERAFAEVRELALAARASGSFRPLTRNPVPQRGGERGMMDGFIGTRDAARNWTPARREWDGLRGGRDVRPQVSSLEARAFAEVRELALDRRAREAEHATRSLRPYLHSSGSWNVLDADFAPPTQWPANHPDSAPFPTITPEGPQYLGYRTPEYLWRTGWEGWTNLTPEQQDEEAIRIRGMGRHNGKECALKRHLSSRDVNCRTAFVCLLCRKAHLASF